MKIIECGKGPVDSWMQGLPNSIKTTIVVEKRGCIHWIKASLSFTNRNHLIWKDGDQAIWCLMLKAVKGWMQGPRYSTSTEGYRRWGDVKVTKFQVQYRQREGLQTTGMSKFQNEDKQQTFSYLHQCILSLFPGSIHVS